MKEMLKKKVASVSCESILVRRTSPHYIPLDMLICSKDMLRIAGSH